MKPGKPPGLPPVKTGDDEREIKRAVFAAVFFGIRLFKNPTTSDEERGDAAVQAQRDADALLGQLEKLP